MDQQTAARKLAEYLLDIQAFRFRPAQPFTWASGWKSPMYTDNRLTVSYPELRSLIADLFAAAIRERYPATQAIAGVATGGIPHGVLAADRLGLPFLYVRSEPKRHGLGNQVEGHVVPGQRVAVVEDLVSTGGSSIKAVLALRESGLIVQGMVSVFTYGFAHAAQLFEQNNLDFTALCTLADLLHVAQNKNVLTAEEATLIDTWKKDPAGWNV